MVELTKEQMDQMLEEVAGYSVQLEEDPTLPQLGTKYLQRVLAQCRNYTNRVQHYCQMTMRYERNLLTEIKQAELDLNFKVKDKLADDAIVRQQKSIEDRKALAEIQLKIELNNLRDLQIKLIDVQETVRLLKFKYSDLQRTSSDIKMQRRMVQDDKELQYAGEEGYGKPQSKQDGSFADGMPAPVPVEPLGPKDILDPNKRPEALPEPLDEAHAQQISEFLRRNPEKKEIQSYPKNGLLCSVCRSYQYLTPSGPSCTNHHGGVDGISPIPEPIINEGNNMSYDDLLS